ncbi:hypothetical protein MKEN_01246000 [Mycena kentingensis (nom. inval.)]|nr:hypothetical protein MKEN_01246000 [Mycena kentingensis (nom. inval.)]
MPALADQLQPVFGPALVGSWINAMVYMLELILAYQYFGRVRRLLSPGAETTFVKIVVIIQLIVDTVGMCGTSAYVYLLVVSHWGDVDVLTQNLWPGTVYCLTLGMSQCIVQMYLIWRYAILSKNYALCVIFGLGAITGLVGSFIGGISTITVFNTVEKRPRVIPIIMMWHISASSVDILVAIALVVQLMRYKTNFKRTQSVIKRLIIGAIQTGSVTSIFALLSLLTFIAYPTTNVNLAFGFVVGRLYGCTLLFNLRSRKMDVHQIVQVDKDNDIRGIDTKLGTGTTAEDMGDDSASFGRGDRKASAVDI